MNPAAHRPWHAILGALSSIAVLCTMLVVAVPAAAQDDPGQQEAVQQEAVFIWQVVVETQADIDELASGGWDLVEARGDDHLLVVGSETTADQLRTAGFTVRVDRELPSRDSFGTPADGGGILDYYGGYRTFTEHLAHLTNVEATFPDLATVYDYGDSWRKQRGRTDNDLMVICITNKQPGDCALNPNSTKPRALIMSAIHARELQTAEVSWRLIDELTGQYGVDADITHILDTTEVWIVPVVNPDGREIVESGNDNPYMQRKNGNDSVGNCTFPATSFNHHGVDLNRNATWSWGPVGTTLDPCAQTYRGTGPASEPEQAALETLFSQLWPDQKGPAWDDPVSPDATGSFITIHSYGNLILIPNGEDGALAPNDIELRTFAFRMAHWNQYAVGTGPEILYATSGTTDDHVYYDLGVPGFTYELSPRTGPCAGFAPPYGCVDASIWPRNRDALLYSMKVAGAPYTETRGPTTLSVTTPASITADQPLVITAAVDDDALGNAAGSFARPTARSIETVSYWIDSLPDDPDDGSGAVMQPIDGAMNEPAESTRVIVTEPLAVGQHTIYVRAQNTDGYWGPVTAAFVNVEAAPGPDVDLDGDTDFDDVRAILARRVGTSDGQFSAAAADVNSDGRISILDALQLAKLIAEQDPG